jgi:hypothetical protein
MRIALYASTTYYIVMSKCITLHCTARYCTGTRAFQQICIVTLRNIYFCQPVLGKVNS